LWLLWTDRYLSRVFQGNLSDRTVITDGPYRFVRHPRYAGLMALQFAFALALGSVLAWGFAIGWLFVNMRRVRLEEVHLRKLFGRAYEDYCSRTPRFIPGGYLFLPDRMPRERED
jgi:protein-S-isoprenylcysteine O-methyltransferase Ste14